MVVHGQVVVVAMVDLAINDRSKNMETGGAEC